LLSSTLRSFTASSPFCLDLIFCWQHPHVHNVCGRNAFHDPLWLVWKPSTRIWPHLGPISAWVRAQVVPAGLRTLWRILSGPCRCRCHHLRRFFLVEKWGELAGTPGCSPAKIHLFTRFNQQKWYDMMIQPNSIH
jgi:hypothetical protein